MAGQVRHGMQAGHAGGRTENQSRMLGCAATSAMKAAALLLWFRYAQRFFTCTLCKQQQQQRTRSQQSV
jgi:hypothetical protein